MALLEKKTVELTDGVLMDVDPTSEFVQLRMGDEKKMIRKSDLYSLCYIIADAENQDKLTAVRQTEVEHFTRLHQVKLKKNMRAGEVIRVRCHISVPVAVVEGLKHIVEKPKRSNIPIIGAK